MTNRERQTVKYLTDAYVLLSDEERENVHSNHRDETGQELPYFRNGATAEDISTAIVMGCPDWKAKDLGINGPGDAYNFWETYYYDEDAE